MSEGAAAASFAITWWAVQLISQTVLLSRVDSQAGTGAEDGDHDAQNERERVSGVQSGCLSRGHAAHSDEEGDEESTESESDGHVYVLIVCALQSCKHQMRQEARSNTGNTCKNRKRERSRREMKLAHAGSCAMRHAGHDL
uniref:Secreted protein n=1 Tax=Rhipicephalus zambeziensis TaxID=60191 RepID=A0A224YFL0_9ACAR